MKIGGPYRGLPFAPLFLLGSIPGQ